MTLTLINGGQAPAPTPGLSPAIAFARRLNEGVPAHYATTSDRPPTCTLAVSVHRLERFLDYGDTFGPCAIHRVGFTDWEVRPLRKHDTRHVGRGISLHDAIDDLVGFTTGTIRASG